MKQMVMLHLCHPYLHGCCNVSKCGLAQYCDGWKCQELKRHWGWSWRWRCLGKMVIGYGIPCQANLKVWRYELPHWGLQLCPSQNWCVSNLKIRLLILFASQAWKVVHWHYMLKAYHLKKCGTALALSAEKDLAYGAYMPTLTSGYVCSAGVLQHQYCLVNVWNRLILLPCLPYIVRLQLNLSLMQFFGNNYIIKDVLFVGGVLCVN